MTQMFVDTSKIFYHIFDIRLFKLTILVVTFHYIVYIKDVDFWQMCFDVLQSYTRWTKINQWYTNWGL